MPTFPDAALTALIRTTSAVVAAYVSRNPLPAKDLPSLIERVHAALAGMRAPSPVATDAPKLPTQAEIAASFRQDHLVSFIDGKSYKTLKRHLAAHGHNPRTYRERYGLPADYPMVAPAYAAHRAQLAKRTMQVDEAA